MGVLDNQWFIAQTLNTGRTTRPGLSMPIAQLNKRHLRASEG
ncbi:hypothetical protein RB1890 [Rhodopirellula baltica SH 1]|uniref:Uncharacterized protein n=1 Tax=Rhodopirellula baltica (strain DSM 10527 / NCIMB 13988 / SH1) TaxID=243090 RepID=Q7UWP4_RHOBA|nr:hypothetical protein RB1890 [Rhodopirellula baltica SH 1]